MITGPERAPAQLRSPDGTRPIAYIATPEPRNGNSLKGRRDGVWICRAAEEFGFEPYWPAGEAHPGVGTRLYARARDQMHTASGLIADLSEPSHAVAMALSWAAAEGVRTLALVPQKMDLDQLTWGLLDDSRAIVVRYPAEAGVVAAARAGLPALTGAQRVDVLA